MSCRYSLIGGQSYCVKHGIFCAHKLASSIVSKIRKDVIVELDGLTADECHAWNEGQGGADWCYNEIDGGFHRIYRTIEPLYIIPDLSGLHSPDEYVDLLECQSIQYLTLCKKFVDMNYGPNVPYLDIIEDLIG